MKAQDLLWCRLWKKQLCVYSRSFKSVLLLQRNSSLPDDTNVARLQEELIAVKLREAEALTGLKELRQQVRDLEDHWQVSTNMWGFLRLVGQNMVEKWSSNCIPFCQRHLARTAGRWKDGPRKNTLSELQDELMSVRFREAEAQAELRETRQRMLEMETQVRAHFIVLTILCQFVHIPPLPSWH